MKYTNINDIRPTQMYNPDYAIIYYCYPVLLAAPFLIGSVMAAISARIKHEVHNFSCHVLQTHWVTKNHEYEISELFWQFRLRRHHVQCLVLCVRGHGHLLLSLRCHGVPLLQDLLQVVGDHVHGHGGT